MAVPLPSVVNNKYDEAFSYSRTSIATPKKYRGNNGTVTKVMGGQFSFPYVRRTTTGGDHCAGFP
jgi:hypothetical protein